MIGLEKMKDVEVKKSIPFSPPDISDSEIAEVIQVLKSGWITTGPRTKELEKRLAEFCHTSKVVCLNSATAAEELNLRICGIGPGDEVIVPAYTYTASASAVIHCGAKVVFIDSQPDSIEMDYDKVALAITEKTKAVIAVDLGGIIIDYDKLYAAVESKKIFLRQKKDQISEQESSRLLAGFLFFPMLRMLLAPEEKGKEQVKLRTLLISHFMPLKILPQQRGALPRGKIFRELTMKKYIINFNYIVCMVKVRMHWLKLNLEHGNMILLVPGINVI